MKQRTDEESECSDALFEEEEDESNNSELSSFSDLHSSTQQLPVGQDFSTAVREEDLTPKLQVFTEHMQKINQQLTMLTSTMCKEAVQASSTGQYPLNSYAFHPKSLV
jgi:hypothetical protein